MSKTDAFLDSQHSLSDHAIKSYKRAIKKFKQIAEKPFEEVYLDQKTVHRFLKILSKELSPSSWNLYLVLYKRLAKWLSDPEDEVCPKLWRKIKRKKIDWEKKLKHKWLTKKEFHHLLDVVDYARDKAMYGVAVEGALRSGELLGLKIRDVQSTSYGYDITVSGKTGSSTFPVVLFAPLLTQWLNQHPFKNDPEAPLWPKRKATRSGGRYNGIKVDATYRPMKRYAKLAGISKSISLHWLHHSKITWTAKDKKTRISDEMAKKMFRWGKGSTMFSRYTHLHGTDSKNAFLSLAGVKIEEDSVEDKTLDPKKCFNCGTLNSAEFLHCSNCGMVLKEEEARRLVAKQRLLEEMMKMHIERMKHKEKEKKKE
jgi:integrase